ncbi:protein MNN4 [Austrofundulus limnaeus]|uniref:Protein MNN4 n=1 Tax=Austrofundulus limnaeus TaxID=52670 RepID=A0A2I4D2K6_AUSLI|nr:PREDICTED: protein MNN4-like [Austrofundulus limnaeus]
MKKEMDEKEKQEEMWKSEMEEEKKKEEEEKHEQREAEGSKKKDEEVKLKRFGFKERSEPAKQNGAFITNKFKKTETISRDNIPSTKADDVEKQEAVWKQQRNNTESEEFEGLKQKQPWVSKLEEAFTGTQPAMGDIKRLLANLLGVPAMEELLQKAGLHR